MLPIALATGTSAEWKNGLAWVIIGGLLSSLSIDCILSTNGVYGVDRDKREIQ